MSFSKIQGTPVQLNLLFVRLDGSPPPAPHYLGSPSQALLTDLVLGLLPSAAGDALNQLLSTPVDQFFDQTWSGLQGTAQSMLAQNIKATISSAYDIHSTWPSKGSLTADVGGLSAIMQQTLPPGTTGSQLTLQYALPGVRASFSDSGKSFLGADASYNLSFDATIEIAVAVPDATAVGMTARAELLTTNMQAGASNFAAVARGIEDLLSDWISGQPGQSGSLADQIISVYIAQLQQLFGQLSAGFAAASGYGFSDLKVLVNPNPPSDLPQGNTIEFGITVPFDHMTAVTNDGVLPPGTPNLLTPQLGTTAPQVLAGGSVGVRGNAFPTAQANQLVVSWQDTRLVNTSPSPLPLPGTVVQSELHWGSTTGAGVPPSAAATNDVKITRSGSLDSTFTATGLAPSTTYAFQVRDFFIQNFLSTDWSAWSYFQTSETDEVQLVLDDGANTVVGTTSLQTDGSLSATITVPTAETPGTYDLWAVLGGEKMAKATLTVVAPSQGLAPWVQFIDENTGDPLFGSVLLTCGQQTAVRGANFVPGKVDVFIDSASGTSLGQASVAFDGSFTVSFTWPYFVVGMHNVHAQQPTVQADAPLYAEMPPK